MYVKVILPLLTIAAWNWCVPISAATDHSREIAEIKAGTRTEARASWWGFNPQNATAALQAALNSGARKIVIDHTGSDWLIDPVYLADHQEIVLAKDVVVAARPGGFQGIRDCLFTAFGKSNLIIRGEPGAVIRMNKADYQDVRKYSRSEWRHAIALWACSNVTIRDLTIKSSGGDGIYIGGKWFKLKNAANPAMPELPPNRQFRSENIRIEKVVCDDHHRQGISVINVKNLVIRGCTLSGTRGTAPAAGIDFEPNRKTEFIENCLMEDCTVRDNSGGGILVATEIDTPISLTVRNCTISGGSRGISCAPPTSRAALNPGTVDFENCTIRDIHGNGFQINSHLASFYRINIRNCRIEKVKLSPICLNYLRPTPAVIGNVAVQNVTITNPGRSLPVTFNNWTPGSYLGEISGNVILDGRVVNLAEYIHANGLDKPTQLQPGSVIPGELTANLGARRQDKPSLQLRRRFTILLWGEKNRDIRFRLKYRKMASRLGPSDLTVTAPDGSRIELGSLKLNQQRDFSFKAPATGIYALPVDISTHIAIFTPGAGQIWSLMTDRQQLNGYLNFFKPPKNTRLYFAVPAGIGQFNVEVTGYPGEDVTAALCGPDDKAAARQRDFDGPHIFQGTASATTAEIWSIRIEKATEDVQIRFIAPLAPVFADSPGNLLIGKK